jgi:hypothetical protein
MPDDPEVDPPEDNLDPGPPPGDDDDPHGDPEPPSGDAGDDPPEPDPDKDWKDLQAKYPGKSDEELQRIVAGAYWAQTKELSQAAKERRDAEIEKARLEGRLEGRGTPPGEEPPEEEDLSDIPEIQEVESTISDLNQRGEELKQEQRDSLKELNDENGALGVLRGRLEAAEEAEDEDKARTLKAEIRVGEKGIKQIRKDLDRQWREAKGLERQMARAEKEKHYLVNLAKEGRAKARQEQQDVEEALEQIPEKVNSAIEASMTDAKVPASLIDDCREIVQDRITVDLWRIGADVPFNEVDVPRLVARHVGHFLKANGVASKADFARRSKDKTDVADEPPKKGKEPDKKARHVSAVSPVGELSPGMARARRLLASKGW